MKTHFSFDGTRIHLAFNLLVWLVGISYWKGDDWWYLSFHLGPFVLQLHQREPLLTKAEA